MGAASYDEAAKLLRENQFDCITLDLSLGERAGVEVLHLLSVINSQAPIIIISGAERHGLRGNAQDRKIAQS